ncbi:MAG: response regulator [Phycisphaerales bacterium]|nr:response regulator [Phycisphaerales bacterium]
MAESLKGKKILVVDDDPDIVTAITATFADTGAVVATASDGATGVKKAESDCPDLIVLDIMLPQKSGFLVLEKLKQLESRPRVIMITGNQGRRHKQYAEALGVDEYLNKPFPMDRLLESATRLLT